jgi:tRNA threonylcarbamoyladenosine modification (KEOPS) complex Cgi121 subunit
MLIKRISTDLGIDEIFMILENENALVVSPDSINSMESAELSLYLAKRSMELKKNISRKLKYEFLLWLCGRRDIKTAMEKSRPKSPNDMVLVSFDGADYCKKLDAKEKSLALSKKATTLEIERISLSRI